MYIFTLVLNIIGLVLGALMLIKGAFSPHKKSRRAAA